MVGQPTILVTPPAPMELNSEQFLQEGVAVETVYQGSNGSPE